MLVIPLLFSALVVGVSELELKHLGRMGARMLGYTVVVSAIAVAIGLLLVNTIRPGEGLGAELRELAARAYAAAPTRPPPVSAVDFLVNMIPDNPLKAAANGDM